MTQDRVPVIDISAFLDGDEAGRAHVVGQVRAACEGIGFFTIVGHGVDPDLIRALRDTARSFFALPEAAKQMVRPPIGGAPRGYRAIGDEGLAYGAGEETPPDLKEVFHLGPPDFPGDDYYTCEAAGAHFIENVYPDAPPQFRETTIRYYRRVEDLCRSIEEVFALALDLPAEFFRPYTDKQIGALRIIHYPPTDTAPVPGQLRAGAHSDYGTFTVLLSENRPGGLQVRTRGGDWIDVSTPEDAFVINIGDLLMRWTNDRFVSNPHRVAIPPDDAGLQADRLSVVFFHHPNYDAEIACIPTCTSDDNPPKYPPVLSGPYRVGKYASTRLDPADQ
ncbi:MAG: isopenicillin N synthase-like dioxygenase [Alphaproteobacteria bacterium]|jgi:isopenicillin N synthase-like dioxygenase